MKRLLAWFLVLPAAALSALLASMLVGLIVWMVKNVDTHFLHFFNLATVGNVGRSLLVPFAFVIGGAAMAPAGKAAIGYTLATFLAVGCAAAMFWLGRDPSIVFQSPQLMAVLIVVGSFGGAVVVHRGDSSP